MAGAWRKAPRYWGGEAPRQEAGQSKEGEEAGGDCRNTFCERGLIARVHQRLLNALCSAAGVVAQANVREVLVPVTQTACFEPALAACRAARPASPGDSQHCRSHRPSAALHLPSGTGSWERTERPPIGNQASMHSALQLERRNRRAVGDLTLQLRLYTRSWDSYVYISARLPPMSVAMRPSI